MEQNKLFKSLNEALKAFYYVDDYGNYKMLNADISGLFDSLFDAKPTREQMDCVIKKYNQWQKIEAGKKKHFSRQIFEEWDRYYRSRKHCNEMRHKNPQFKTEWAFEALTGQSPLAYKLKEEGYDYEVWDVLSHSGEYGYVESPFNAGCEFSFHPTGNCGCITSDDISYSFGIRCRHLMWSEGWCEDGTDEDGYYEGEIGEPSSILIYANHKGYFYMRLIVFKRKTNSETEEDNDNANTD